jgi:hypothetical protein
MTSPAAAPDQELHAAIAAVLDEYFTRWSASDMEGLQELWDADEPDPIYVAEEREPLIGWEAVRGYWRPPRPGMLERLIRYDDLQVRPIAEDVALAFYTLSWNLYMRRNPVYPRPIGGRVRATTLLRRREAGWRIFHHIEGPTAAFVQVRDLLEMSVDPEFAARVAAEE